VGISGRCQRQTLQSNSSSFPVRLDSSNRFTATDDARIYGFISTDYRQMIQGLLEEDSLELHVSCDINPEPLARKLDSRSSQLSCLLSITIYGRFELFQEIGSWFDDYEIYLQDPLVCHRDVRYCNPHRLSSDSLEFCDSYPLVSQVVARSSNGVRLEDIAERPELLDILSSHAELEETPQPAVIKSILKR
jgi:hypothetical protein